MVCAGCESVAGMYTPVAALPNWRVRFRRDSVSVSFSGAEEILKDPYEYMSMRPSEATLSRKNVMSFGVKFQTYGPTPLQQAAAVECRVD
jgi:hypothetical protein